MKNKENQNIPVQSMTITNIKEWSFSVYHDKNIKQIQVTIEATELYYAFINILNFGY